MSAENKDNQDIKITSTKSSTKSLIKSSTNIEKLFNLNISKIAKSLNPLKLKSLYIMLDSSNNIYMTKSDTKLKWNFTYDGILRLGTVTSFKKVYNFVGMRCYNIKLNVYPASDLFGDAEAPPVIEKAYLPWYLKDREASILVEELSAQSYIAHEDRRFHFIGKCPDPAYSADLAIDFDRYNKGYFWFAKPIYELTTITLSIGNPVTVVPWPYPATPCFINAAPAAATTTVTLSIYPYNPVYKYAVGDRVFFTRTDFGNSYAYGILDPGIYSELCRQEGHVILSIVGNDIEVDCAFPGNPGPTTVRFFIYDFERNKTIVPIEFFYVDNDISEGEDNSR